MKHTLPPFSRLAIPILDFLRLPKIKFVNVIHFTSIASLRLIILVLLIFCRVIRNTVFSMDPTISQNNETSKISYPDSGEVSPVPSHEMLIDPPNELFQMLFFAGPYLYRDALLLQKVTT